MNALSNFLRAIFVAFIALLGMAMALVFMLSTAVAVGLLYIVAKVRGKPFAIGKYWQARRSGASPWGFSASNHPGRPAPRHDDNIIDVQAREIR
jgi:hypothetical protein